ncbi:WavE lipopolysaccharide synthesis family protein [bacterium]|nr:WavE lipopolysaccharide synthesis family protein [bacterium]
MLCFKIITLLIKKFEIFSNNYFFSALKREKYSANINSSPDIKSFSDRISIVMQGPIIEKNDFTLETLKLYKKRYPNISIILSTWDNYEKDLISKFTKIGIEVILNSMPDYFGISNVNLQIKSTKSGILKARQAGCQYCLKTRTDQRVYKHDFILFFLSILASFKINHKYLKERLITRSMNTFKYRLYGVTDMLMFGNIDDMILYWDAELDNRKLNEVDEGISALDFSKARLCEVYLSTEFFKKIKFEVDFTLKNYWQSMAAFFFVVDANSIDIFWFKYNRWNERRRYQNKTRKLDEEFYFSDWLNSHNNLSHYTPDGAIKINKENMI